MVDTQWNELEIASKPVVMQAAQQFADALGDTPQYREFEVAYFTFRRDAEVQNAIHEFQQKQASLKALLVLNAVGEKDRMELQALQDRIYQQPSYLRYSKAQEELVALSQKIGDLLSEAIGLDYGASCKAGGCCG